jgi:hypothetical protein
MSRLRTMLSAARVAAIRMLGGTTREHVDAASEMALSSLVTASTLAGAIDDAIAMAYDANGQCRDCCRGIGRGHATYCGIALVLAPLIGTARAGIDRQHEHAIKVAASGKSELQA